MHLVDGTFLLEAQSPGAAVRTNDGTLVVGGTVTLAGSGDVTGGLFVEAGGVIDMGFSDTDAASLDVLGSLTMEAGSSLIIDLNAPYAMAGRDYDQFIVRGNLNLNNPILVLNGAEQLSTTPTEIVLLQLANSLAIRNGEFDPNLGALFH